MTAVLPTTRIDPGELRTAFGTFPSGLVAVAAEVDGEPRGLVVSSFTSVSLSPALVSISLALTSSTWPHLRRAERLGLSVLSEGHRPLARQLAGPADRRFDGVPLRAGRGGALTLHDAVATFETSVEREVQAGDHLLLLLELHQIDYAREASPLVFHRSDFTTVNPRGSRHAGP